MADKNLEKRLHSLVAKNAEIEESQPDQETDWEAYRDSMRFNVRAATACLVFTVVFLSIAAIFEYLREDPKLLATLFNGDTPEITISDKSR